MAEGKIRGVKNLRKNGMVYQVTLSQCDFYIIFFTLIYLVQIKIKINISSWLFWILSDIDFLLLVEFHVLSINQFHALVIVFICRSFIFGLVGTLSFCFVISLLNHFGDVDCMALLLCSSSLQVNFYEVVEDCANGHQNYVYYHDCHGLALSFELHSRRNDQS